MITGEGRADEQTLHGKAAMGVATLAGAREHAGRAAVRRARPRRARRSRPRPPSRWSSRFRTGPISLEAAMADTQRLLEKAAARLARAIGIGLTLAP